MMICKQFTREKAINDSIEINFLLNGEVKSGSLYVCVLHKPLQILIPSVFLNNKQKYINRMTRTR